MLAFVEYATPDPKSLSQTWQAMGLTASREEDCFVSEAVCLSACPREESRTFLERPGPGLTGFGLKVKNPDGVLKGALEEGIPVSNKRGYPVLELTDTVRIALLPRNWAPAFTAEGPLQSVDHLALNVVFGARENRCRLMEKLFGFRRQKTFSIRGKKTGFTGSSLLSPCGTFRIVINESPEKASQINTFITEQNGEGLQHLAFSVKDIFSYMPLIRKSSIQLYEIPESYYKNLKNQKDLPDLLVDRAKESGLLLDGEERNDTFSFLLQIFTRPLLGSAFAEIIQRMDHEGFGEKNITALFEAIERNQK